MPTIQNSARKQWSGLLVIGLIIGGGCGSEPAKNSEPEKSRSPIVVTAANTSVKKTMAAPASEKPTQRVAEPVSLELPTELPISEVVPASTTVAEPSRTQPTNVLPHSRILLVPTRDAEMTAAAHTFEELQTAYEGQKPTDYQAAEAKLLRFGPDAIPVLLDRLTETTTDKSIQQELASMMLLQILPETLLVDPSFPKDLRIRVFRTLPEALNNPSADVRINIATALSLFQDPPPQLVPALQGLLKSDAVHHRLMALVALGNLGPHSVIASSDIREKLNDENSEVREAAKRTLDLMAAAPKSLQ